MDISTDLREFHSKIEAQEYDEAVRLYYGKLDKPLYWSGENIVILDLLSMFVPKENGSLLLMDSGLNERVFRSLAETYRITGQPKKATALFESLLKSCRNRQDHRTSAIVLRNLGRIMLSVGELKAAEELINSGIASCLEAEEAGLESGLHRQLGILFSYEGRFDEARVEISYLPKGFGKHNHSDFSVYEDKCLHSLLDIKERSKTIYYATEMIKLTKKYPYRNDKVLAQWLLGLSYLHAGDLSRSLSNLDEALADCRQCTYLNLEPDILLAKGRWFLTAQKNIHNALKAAKDALAIALTSGYKLKQAEILNFLGKVTLDNGDSAAAQDYALVAYNVAMCNEPPHYYKQAVLEAENTLLALKIKPPRRYYSCFISYNHEDSDFAHRIHKALKIRDINCWLDEHEILPGDYFLGNIDDGIRRYDKVLLCCSKNSLRSFWVDTEIDKALQKEKQLWDQHKKRTLVMIPLDLDGYLHTEWDDPKSTILRGRLSADFTGWELDEQKFQNQFEKLLLALKVQTEVSQDPEGKDNF